MDDKNVLLDHGSGGKIAHSMLTKMILPLFDNPLLAKMDDSAVLDLSGIRVSFSTDSYVVDPIFFPGGNIGDLAVNGTVNDISMCGGDPLYISVALILEEGFAKAELSRILESMGEAAKRAGVMVVTGDTKVLPRGKVDKIFINTSGVGIIPEGINLSGSNASPGDKVIVSGTIADHGITILSSREGLGISPGVQSDSAPLNGMVKSILNAVPYGTVHVLRDPTRGGVATTLNEIASQSNVTIRIKEEAIPVKDAVRGTCELLGFDPLYVANEGKLLAIVSPEVAEDVLRVVRSHESGRDASVIGEVYSIEDASCLVSLSGANYSKGSVILETVIGGARVVDMLTGEQLPRIC
ncbi:carbamoyl phosphate phosphatase, hydrogenase 3 maturation protein [Desulfamplus magnetovallimortis]|uniref:Carbamoyl phosphate phosphatase, hydrogenase 3 maturation protein n=1 Tax=Desulfamplus magnetovallimortis TaxID=1246637 RepID=A0A1W1HCR2_9BACT|nr:hydrogenase expression/formation protein HypE [Desulfamplus magnetovallimortis]SLM30175.1 carbamoyl phosphate phosphatase, hydrogenase 3 maturation protein [Desulfamplus magnetovallimortis]